ncbi:MAG: VIT domain-containing protein [Candidatus Kariarchaeaceae archaeon]|jgi:Ca-activated chloride channel family protein
MKTIRVALLILLLVPFLGTASPVIDEVTVDSVAIGGSITDNYANLTFSYEVTNPVTVVDEIVFRFGTDDDLYLSNFSLELTDLTYWGVVKPIETAQQEYQNATENNQTAVLVQKIGTSYQTSFNLQPEETGVLTFYFEGYLKRVLGAYDFTLLDLTPFQSSITLDVSVDLLLVASALQLRSARLFGFNGVSVSKLSDAEYRLEYSQSTTLTEAISLRYRYFSDGIQSQLLTYTNGTDNFFMYSFAPEIYDVNDIVDREYIFVIDTSGSMNGARMSNAKIAFNALLETLTSTDLFNIVAFSSQTNTYQAESVVGSTSNIADAQSWVDDLIATGSTNIEAALTDALDLFSTSSSTAKVVIFLSDGEPTVGVGSGDRTTNQQIYNEDTLILNSVNAANTMEATFYSISLGTQTAEGLMASLAFQTGGDFAIVQNEATLDDDLARLYENFRYPVATSLDIDYTGASSSIYPLASQMSNHIFNGSEVIQTGLYTGSLEISTSIVTSSGSATYTESTGAPGTTLDHIERLWAINQINAMLQLNIRADKQDIKAQIVQLAVYYQLVVDGYTALILVVDEKDNETTDDQTETKTATDSTGQFTQTTVGGSVEPPVNTVVDTLDSSLDLSIVIPIFSLLALVPVIRRRSS